MPDILEEINGALASGNLDDATVKRLIAGARAELGQGAQPPKMAQVRKTAGRPPEDFDEWFKNYQHKQGLPDAGIESFGAGAGAAASKFLNGMTLGGYNGARRLIMGDEAGRQQISREDEMLNSNPVSRFGGNVAGMSGGGMLLGPAGEGLTGMIEGAVPAMAKTAAGRVGTQAATGGALGATAEAGQAASEGEGFWGGAKRALKGGAVGLALGGGLGAFGEAVSYAKNALRDKRSDLGETVTAYAKAKDEGRLPRAALDPRADPALAAEIKKSKFGQGGVDQVADSVAQEMADYNPQVVEKARKVYGKKLQQVVNDQQGQFKGFDGLHKALDRLEGENVVNGEVVDKRLGKAIDDYRKMFTQGMDVDVVPTPPSALDRFKEMRGQSRNDAAEAASPKATPAQTPSQVESGYQGYTQKSSAPTAAMEGADESLLATPEPTPRERVSAEGGTLEDLLKAEKATKSLAEHDNIATQENRPYRLISGALKKEAKRIGGEPLQKLMAKYAKTMDRVAQANDLAFGKEVPVLNGPNASAERSAAARLSRRVDRPGAGTENNLRNPSEAASQRQREELASLDPKYADQLSRIDAKAAYESTRLPGPIESALEPVKSLKASRNALAARVADPTLQSLARQPLRPRDLQGLAPGWIPGIEDAVTAARKRKKLHIPKSPRKSP